MGDAQAVLAPYMLDMLWPRIDEGDVLTGLHHVGAGIAADRTRTNNRYFPTHAFLPGFLAPSLARRRGYSQMAQGVARVPFAGSAQGGSQSFCPRMSAWCHCSHG